MVLEITMTEQEQETKSTTNVVEVMLILTQVVIQIIRMDCTLQMNVKIRVWRQKFVKQMEENVLVFSNFQKPSRQGGK